MKGFGNNSGNVIVFKRSPDFKNRFLRLFRRASISFSSRRYGRRRKRGATIFSDDRTRYGSEPLTQLPDADVINLHWIARFIDYQATIPAMAERSRLVWTLHDMNPFTGGCHYSMACRNYEEACGRCPQLKSDSYCDLSRSIWARKYKVFARLTRKSLTIVAPSKWLANRAKESSLLGNFDVYTLPNGLDTDLFMPREGTIGKQLLGLPAKTPVVLFLAESTTDKRKGLHYLIAALSKIARSFDAHFVAVGEISKEFQNVANLTFTGSIRNDRILSFIYSAADVFVIPSVADNLPNTVLESMACGTPVVGFDVGGIPDMVRPGITGALVPVGDVDALSEAIVDLLNDAVKREEMSANCRRIAEEEYSLEVVGRRYKELYEKILNK
jgi:glycosyltransferase involved in cell wall biosynthesis